MPDDEHDDELHPDDVDPSDAWDLDPDWEHVPPEVAMIHMQQVEVIETDEDGEQVTGQATYVVVPGLWRPRDKDT